MAGRKKERSISVSNSNVGVYGDNANIEGGIHFHQHYGTKGDGQITDHAPSVKDGFDPENSADILHISDLHFGADKELDPYSAAKNWFSQLAIDLIDDLGCKRLQAVIVSGDIGNFSEREEYQAAEDFFRRLRKKFDVDASQIVIVPGNHDLNWKLSKKGYQLIDKEDHDGPLTNGKFIPVSEEVVRLCDKDAYPLRFKHFSKFYENITGQSYPLALEDQATFHHIPYLNLFVVGLNSNWEADHHFRNRISINPEAITAALDYIRDHPELKSCLKIAVWHHPLNSEDEDRIKNHDFMQRLSSAGFQVCLHGHIHKAKAGLYRYDMPPGQRQIHVVGAGTFGAPVMERSSGCPLQYNLIRLSGNILRVVSRSRREVNGTWGPDHLWRQGKGLPNLAHYDLSLSIETPVKTTPWSNSVNPEPSPIAPIKETDTEFEEEVGKYKKKIGAIHGNLLFTGFQTRFRVPISIKDIYLPLRAIVDKRIAGDACFGDSEEAEKCLREHGSEEISIPDAFKTAEGHNRRGVVILGDPGAGKTTHLKRVLLWCIEGGPEKIGLPAGLIPVFLPLRELEHLNEGLDVFIEGQLDNPLLGSHKGFGKSLLKYGKLLFLLDGLDEVSDVKKRIQVSKWINDAHRFYERCYFVVTCRFAGYTKKTRLNEEFLEMAMRPLTKKQAEAFIHNWYKIVETNLSEDQTQAERIAKEKADKLIERLKRKDFRSMRIFSMIRNPLLLTNLCIVHWDRGHLPKQRSRLYKESIDVLLELWHEAVEIKGKIDAQTARRVLQPVAYWLHQQKDRTRASAKELEREVDKALAAVGWHHGSALDFLEIIRDESGLLTGWGHDQFGFMHLGFQEYLTALEIKNRAYRDSNELEQLAEKFGKSWWREVILLLLAQDNPCLFKEFMAEVVKKEAFVQYTDLVEICFEETAEQSIEPFMNLLITEPGNDPKLWDRQLAALKTIDRFEKIALDNLIRKLSRHPSAKINQWIKQKSVKDDLIVVGNDVINLKEDWNIEIQPELKGHEVVLIPGGRFKMGSNEYDDEQPIHDVDISSFYMSRYPITNEEYARFITETGHREPEYWAEQQFNRPQQPVVGVNWYDAKKYAKWAGMQLPTEAQWEYACRAGAKTRYYTGNKEKDLDKAGWYDENSDMKLHTVGQKEPNLFGLYDMHGNVWEWCEDHYHDNYEGAPEDGSAWADREDGALRVLRGGSWIGSAVGCRAAGRYVDHRGFRRANFGFRLVRLPGQRGESSK